MLLPTAVDPVNATLRTSGCPLRYDPTGSPSPTTTLRTPLGRPAASHSLAPSSPSSGACSSGLSTTALPAARAGAIFQTITSRGMFHGTIAATTPSGSRRRIPSAGRGPHGGTGVFDFLPL